MRIRLSVLALASVLPGTGWCQTYTIDTFAGGRLPENIPALLASVGGIGGVATDAAGNVYMADPDYNVIWRRDSAGLLTRVAGNGTLGYSGDYGPATKAQLNSPTGVAVDSAGNLYIADAYNNRIRRVSNGVITTVAGTGVDGGGGDDGPATSAQLKYPTDVAVDSAGDLYIADSYNNRIRKVSNGVITTVAGTGVEGGSGDNGPATDAQLSYPEHVAVDSTGNLYISDAGNSRIRKVSNGVIATVWVDCDGWLCSWPGGIAVDSEGNLYMADGSPRIRKLSGGVITTVAGDGILGNSGDNGPATKARLSWPTGVAVDSAGNLYIADSGNQRVRKVSDGVITTVAGGGYSGDNGPATSAQLLSPERIAVDSAGNLYIAEHANNRVRKVSNGGITTVAGNGTKGYSGDNGPATDAQLSEPSGVAVDSAGNLYIADAGNSRIRKVSNGVITTVAGNGGVGDSGDNGPATSAELYYPTGIAVDSYGNLYIVQWPCQVRKVSNGVITNAVGNGSRGFAGDNGPATSAQLSYPWDLAVDSAGNLYIAELGSHRIRKVSNGVITTVAGNGDEGYSGDSGPATSAQLRYPYGVAVDSADNLYIADTDNHRIRKVTNGVITTVAGSGNAGYGGDNGLAVSAQLSNPHGVAVDALGSVYIADSRNHRVRVLTPGPCRQSVSTTDLGVAAAGGTLALSIQTDSNCAWSLSGLPAWLTVSGSSQGIGPAIVNLVADANAGGSRTGLVSVGSVSVPVRQTDATACGGSSSCVVRSLPHLAFGGEWTTVLSAVSSGSGAGSFSINFYGDSGASVALPFTGWLGSLSTLTDGVPAQGLQYYEAENPGAPVQAAWGLVTTDASVTVHAIFRRRTPGGAIYEAAVPSSGGYSSFVVPFDATTLAPAGVPMFIGLAISNFNPSVAANVVCTARDQLGAILPNAISIPPLSPLGHYSDYRYPALTGKRGTLTCTADTLVSAIALRFIGNDAFSTLPVIVR